MGHPGDDAFDPLIDDARSQGIIVTVMNTELPKAAGQVRHGRHRLRRGGPARRRCGPRERGYRSRRPPVRRSRPWSGASSLRPDAVSGRRASSTPSRRPASTVDYLEIDDATNADPAAGVSTFTGYASSHPDLKAIFIDHGNLTSTIPTYMKAAGLEPGQHLRGGLRPLARDGPGRQGRLRQPGHRPAAVPAGLPRNPADLPDRQVRVQRSVRQHRRRLRRQGQHRRDRATRHSSRFGDVAVRANVPTLIRASGRPSGAAGGADRGTASARRLDASSSATSPSRSVASTSCAT